ncbi:V-set and immunoglobulin domain-containing protein 1 [Discoglossus pictus]
MSPSSLLILAILGSLTGSVHCLQVNIPQPALNVTAGSNATLYCTYSPAGTITNNLFIQWSLFEAQSQQFKTVYYFQNEKSYSYGNFKNRVTAALTPGNASITISNMQPQESGLYNCEVSNPPEPMSQGKIQLTVMAPPSMPHCTIRGAVETGHHLSLLCYSEVGMPRPLYSWNKVVDGLLKPTPPNMDYQSGSLIIGNMTNFDDGHYRCTASNSLGNATCEIDMHTGGAAGVIAAGVIGAILLAVIIIAVIWVLIVRKKKKSKKQQLPASEMKIRSSSGANPEFATVNEPARENLTASEPPEAREYHDQPEEEAAASGKMEDPEV